MINFKAKNGTAECNAFGTLIDIGAESLALIRGLYLQFYDESPLKAFAFKDMVQKSCMDDNSPVWDLITNRGGE